MKLRINTAVILLAVVFVFAFTACENQVTTEPEARLLGLSIGNVRASYIPKPISSGDWDSIGISYDLEEDAPYGGIFFPDESDLTETRIRPSVSSGARIRWGIGSRSSVPDEFDDYRKIASFSDNDFLYFMVTSSDDLKVNYYRFYAHISSPVTEIANVSIAGRDVRGGKMPAPAGNPQDALSGLIYITTAESRNALVVAERYDDTSKVRYAVTDASNGDGAVFRDSDRININDTQFLLLQVTAENGNINYYKFRVFVGRLTDIKTLKFVDKNNAKVEATNVGTPDTEWASTSAGSFSNADQPNDGYTVEVELEDPLATTTFGKMAAGATDAPGLSATKKYLFANNETLVIRVLSENRRASVYYKIRVNLLAANITVQPASAAYYVDIITQDLVTNRISKVQPKATTTIAPLSFTLDRTGTFTYQWYEANSWYGGYGFDADGRIVTGKDNTGAWVTEAGFVEDDYHVKQFDEKNNVVFHNGGNQFYRLVTPGRAIPGATKATFTPYSADDVQPDGTTKINHSPFIGCATSDAGYTNETHYYWVVVTDSAGRTVTSNRAAIVSETDVNKKHYIVDLNNLRDKNNKLVPAKNTTAFVKQYDSWEMPLAFPNGFDIMDYSICIAQARFYLKDGTPWIQNWTQGNLSFEADGESKVLFYNLTNNNATYGLDGDSKVPLGANLENVPDSVTTYVSGEKSPNNRPPFKEDGVTPENINDAQGWFCHFIELVELRFEGPRRNR